MPYKSEKQRKFMHAKHPKIARKWDEEYGSKVVKRMTLDESEKLRRAKKFNVGTSTASGLLGVGALGALTATRAPQVAARVGRGAAAAPKLKRIGDKATVPLSAASLGIGGVGSLNFAAVQNREANALRRRKKVSKSMKALGSGAKAGKFVNSTKGPKYAKKTKPKTPQERFEALSASGRKPERSFETMLGTTRLGNVRGISGTAKESFRGRSNPLWEAGGTSRVRTAQITDSPRLGRNVKLGEPTYETTRGRLTPTGAGVAAGAVYGGGLGGAMYVDQKQKKGKAKTNVRKSMDIGMDFGLSSVRQGDAHKVLGDETREPVFKAYDPERSRRRRLDTYSHGAAAGAGVAAAGATQQGMYAAGKGKPKNVGHVRSANVAGLKRGYARAGRSGALGLTAIGLGVGASKIQSYKRGGGRSWKPREYD